MLILWTQDFFYLANVRERCGFRVKNGSEDFYLGFFLDEVGANVD